MIARWSSLEARSVNKNSSDNGNRNDNTSDYGRKVMEDASGFAEMVAASSVEFSRAETVAK